MLWNMLSLSPKQLLLSSKPTRPTSLFISFLMARPELTFSSVPFAPCCQLSVSPGTCLADMLETGLAVNANGKENFGLNCLPSFFLAGSAQDSDEESAVLSDGFSRGLLQNLLYFNEREVKETKKVMKVCYLHNREVWPKFRSLEAEI